MSGQQTDWRFCGQCNALFYDGFPNKGICPSSTPIKPAGHLASGINFDLSYDYPETGTLQANWRYCDKCGVMFSTSAKGVCQAGGAHQAQGFNFALPHDVAETPTGQAAWRSCSTCGAMFYDGNPTKGLCPGTKQRSLSTRPPTGGGSGGATFIGGHTAVVGFNFVLPHDLAVSSDGYPTCQLIGPVWVVGLDHNQAQSVETAMSLISSVVSKVPAPPPLTLVPAAIAGALTAASQYIQLMDSIGGNQGVDVQGVIGVNGVIVTPHVSGMYEQMIQGARSGIAVDTVVAFILKLGVATPSVASSLGIETAVAVAAKVASGTPLGWAVAGALGVVVDLVLPTPDPNDHGGVHADRTAPGAWESFIISQIPPGNMVTLLSWMGLFSAQNGGGGDVYANQPARDKFETWAIIDNRDGTVSFKSYSGQYLTALNGGGDGSYCSVNATSIGPNEKFHMEYLPNGRVALKTMVKGTYVSVQSGK